MGFTGWPAEAVAFFTGLQADNTKAYWTANKARYEASVRGPMAELLGEQHWPVAPWLHTAQAGDRVADFFRTAAPLRHWLDRNVGPDPG